MTASEQSMLLSAVTERIVRTADPEKIVLFGSRAAGTATDQSDLDLLVIEREPFGKGRSRRKEAARIWLALMDIGIAKDILLYSSDEIAGKMDNAMDVVGQAMRYGKVIYER